MDVIDLLSIDYYTMNVDDGSFVCWTYWYSTLL